MRTLQSFVTIIDDYLSNNGYSLHKFTQGKIVGYKFSYDDRYLLSYLSSKLSLQKITFPSISNSQLGYRICFTEEI